MADIQQETKGDRLKKIRKEMNLDQTEFASLFGISQSFLSGIEKERYDIPYDVMVKLVSMGYNLNWLLVNIGEMKLSNKETTTEDPDRLAKIEAFLKANFPNFKP